MLRLPGMAVQSPKLNYTPQPPWPESLSQKGADPLEASRFSDLFTRLAGEGQTPFGIGSSYDSVANADLSGHTVGWQFAALASVSPNVGSMFSARFADHAPN